MKLLPSILLAMTKNNKRDFQFVPSGQSYSTNRPTISCDGRIPGGVTLELTHWTDNETPNHLYADTSTEMALKLAQQPGDFLENAMVLNNHYDTDGVLSSWACLVEPHVAIQYADLLREGAEAGDFGEWSSDNGIKLNEAVEAMRREDDDDEKAYKTIFQELPSLLDDIQVTGGESYKHLWAAGFEHALDSWKELESIKAKIERGPGRIAILCESPSLGRSLSPYALHRGLLESNLWEETTRILRVTTTTTGNEDTRKKYVYEQIGHGWVQKLVKRPTVPDISDKSQFVAHLNSDGGANWRVGGSSLVSICQWNDADAEIQDVAAALHRTDSGSQ